MSEFVLLHTTVAVTASYPDGVAGNLFPHQ